MKIFKQYVLPILIILGASSIVVLASLSLAKTDWAESYRTEFGDRRPPEDFKEGERPRPESSLPAVFMLFAPLVKVIILMGIGGLFTALVLRIIKFVSERRKSIPQGSG